MLAVLGHDGYLYYQNQDKGFQFSDIGFLWTTYHPESYRAVVEQISGDLWNTLNYFLTFEAFYVTLGFACIFYAMLIVSLAVKGSKEKSQSFDTARRKFSRKR